MKIRPCLRHLLSKARSTESYLEAHCEDLTGQLAPRAMGELVLISSHDALVLLRSSLNTP